MFFTTNSHITYKTKMCMATREANPGNPKKPEIKAVNTLIGMCNPIEAPKTLKKKINNTPITTFTAPLARNFIGVNGAPAINSIPIRSTIEITIMVELKQKSSFACPFDLFYEQTRRKRTSIVIAHSCFDCVPLLIDKNIYILLSQDHSHR